MAEIDDALSNETSAGDREGIVYLHGFASGPGSSKARFIVPRLMEDGLRVFVPDLNEGDFEHLTISRAIARARRDLRDRSLVIGSSMGAYVATLLALEDPRVKGLVLMAPAVDMAERLRARHGDAGIEAWRLAGSVQVEHYAYGGLHRLDYGFFADALKQPRFPEIRVPAVVIQGEHDPVVPADLVRKFCSSQGPHVELSVVDDDHGLIDSASLALEAARRLLRRLGFHPGGLQGEEARPRSAQD